ncbi:MAG: sulfatase family protein [Armatimonadota bacterium]
MNNPNFIVIFADNLGYGDFGCYGSTVHRTPHVDRLAAEGVRFTSFYSTSGVCTPSRASMMTGCYPRRVGLHESGEGLAVLRPLDHAGLHPDEITVAKLLQNEGYATACIGKWHLGDQDPFLPTSHGFDTFYGIPYSDDMTPRAQFPAWPLLPLMRDKAVTDAPIDRDYLTRLYTEETCRFIRDNHDRPFFIYLPHAMPGSTNRPFAHPDFQGKSANGPYGDCIEEMDWSTGEIMKTLEELGLDDNTVVIWTSDNGATFQDPPQGSNAPLKGYGYDTSEGAMRMPCIARWPGRIAAGRTCDELSSTMDVLPTLAALAGADLPHDRIIDGQNLAPLLCEDVPGSAYDHKGFFYYFMGQLQAVRSGPWKLYLPLPDKHPGVGRPAADLGLALFNVADDLGETHEASSEHPEVVQRLLSLAEQAREDIGDGARQGKGQRPAGWVEHPVARVK